MRRLTWTIHLVGRQQTDNFELMLTQVNLQQNEAMEQLRLFTLSNFPAQCYIAWELLYNT